MKLLGHNKKAFTLIELLVVVAIIGILAAVGVVAYNGYTYGARVAVAKNNYQKVVKTIQAEMRKCDLGENQVMGFISCSLTAEQRQGALTSSSNTAKIQSFFSGMQNPFCGNPHDCAAPEDVPLYLSWSGEIGSIATASESNPLGVYIFSTVDYKDSSRSGFEKCNIYAFEKKASYSKNNCLMEFIYLN